LSNIWKEIAWGKVHALRRVMKDPFTSCHMPCLLKTLSYQPVNPHHTSSRFCHVYGHHATTCHLFFFSPLFGQTKKRGKSRGASQIKSSHTKWLVQTPHWNLHIMLGPTRRWPICHVPCTLRFSMNPPRKKSPILLYKLTPKR